MSVCILCPERERIPYRNPVCESCRSWLGAMLSDLRALVAELMAERDLVPDLRVAPAVDNEILRVTGHRIAWRDLDDKVVVRRRDVIAAILPSTAPAAAIGVGPIGGTREPPAPVNLDVADALGASRRGSLGPHARQDQGTDPDQVGLLPLATVLEVRVRDWIEHRERSESQPPALVGDMLVWLHTRIDEACDTYPAIEEFAAEIRRYRSVLRGLLGLIDLPEYKHGVACPKCDARALYRRNGSDWIECGECPNIMSDKEYEQHTADLRDDAVRTTVAAVAWVGAREALRRSEELPER